MSIDLNLEKIANTTEEAARRALVVLGERGQQWLEANAPEVTGFYKERVSLDVRPDGSVLLSVEAPYAKALESRRGIFNRMLNEVLNPAEVRKEVSAQVFAALAGFPQFGG